jgi:hypothetical protein
VRGSRDPPGAPRSLLATQFPDFRLCGRSRILAAVFGGLSPHPKIPFPAVGPEREVRPRFAPVIRDRWAGALSAGISGHSLLGFWSPRALTHSSGDFWRPVSAIQKFRSWRPDLSAKSDRACPAVGLSSGRSFISCLWTRPSLWISSLHCGKSRAVASTIRAGVQ